MNRTCITALALLVAGLTAAPAGAGDDPPAKPRVPLSKFFQGKVLSIAKDAFVEIEYDFSTAAHMKDFEVSIPFRAVKTVKWKLEQGRLRIEGTGSLRHKAVFKDVAGATATFQPVKNRDFGFAISEERESEVYTLYCVYDRYFSSTDNVDVPQNMIIKFLARDPKRNADGMQDWRYCGSRGQKPVIKRGAKYEVTCRRDGMKSSLQIGDWESKGKEAGRDLTAKMVALYTYKGDVRVERFVVRGSLDPEYVRKHDLDVTPTPKEKKPAGTAEPDGTPEPEIPADEAARVRAKIADYPRGTKPRALAKMLRDPALGKTLRAEAARRAVDHGGKQIVPWLFDGMYDEDATARRLSFQVFKSLTGKAFGYRPDGSKTSRDKAVTKMAAFVKKNAGDFR